MKMQDFKKITAIILTAIFAISLFTCIVFAEDVPEEAAEKTLSFYTFSGTEGMYEEMELSEGWVANDGRFTNTFAIETVASQDIYLLKLANIETAYKVLINGQYLPSNKSEIDITQYVFTDGNANEITIEAERISGSIRIVHTPLLTLGSVSVVPNIETGEITANVSVRNRSEIILDGHIEIAIYELGVFKKNSKAMHISVGSKEMDFEVEPQLTDTVSIKNVTLNNFDETRMWTNENPFMYEIVVKLGENEINSFFCMRTVGEEAGYKTLNGHPIFIKGYRVTDETFEEISDFPNINALVINGNITNDRQENADKAGLLIFNYEELPNLLIIDEQTPEEIAKIRVDREYMAMAGTDREIFEKVFSDIGIFVNLEAEKAGRGEKFVVDVSVVNDLSEDLSDAVATFEVKHKNNVISTATKDYESLKKFGTQGRDVMTREFDFEVPNTIKDGEDVEITIVVKTHGEETTWSKSLYIAGGDTYEAPYSGVAVIATLGFVAGVIALAAITAAVRHRREKRK